MNFRKGLIGLFLISAMASGRNEKFLGNSFLPLEEKVQEECPISALNSELAWWKYIDDSESAEHDNDWKNDEWWPFQYSENRGGGDCDDYAIASATKLQEKGYSPLILCLPPHLSRLWLNEKVSLKITTDGHAVHLLIDKRGRYGINGVNKQDRICPEFDTLSDLFKNWEYTRNIVSPKIKYQIVDLSEIDLRNYSGNILSAISSSLPEEFLEIENPNYETNLEQNNGLD